MSVQPSERGLRITRRGVLAVVGITLASTAIGVPLGRAIADSGILLPRIPQPEGPEDRRMDTGEERALRQAAEGSIDTMFARWKRLSFPVSSFHTPSDFEVLGASQFPDINPQRVNIFYTALGNIKGESRRESVMIAYLAKEFGREYSDIGTRVGIVHVVGAPDELKFIVFPKAGSNNLRRDDPIVVDISTLVDAAMRFDPTISQEHQLKWREDVRRRVLEAQKQ